MAAGEGGRAGFVDTLFTATSAVCVTGLITVDTASAWSPFGQVVLLVLIQAGGPGILTVSTFFAILFGRRLTFGQREVAERAHGHVAAIDLRWLVRRVVAYALAVAAVGAAMLSFAFAGEAGWRAGLQLEAGRQ